MNLYRLDFKRGELPTRPVIDKVIGRDYLGRSYSAALNRAHNEANAEGWPVIITRISNGGSMQVVRTVNPIQWSA